MSTDPAPHSVMMNMVTGYWISKMIHVVTELGIPDLLAAGPQRATELAEATGTNAERLYRVLRALASVDVFAEDEDRRFDLTAVGSTLRRDHPASMHAFVSMVLDDSNWQAWNALDWAVRTGDVAFDKAMGMSPWEYTVSHPAFAQVAGEAMTSLSAAQNPAITAAYDFSGIATLADIGGGHGSLLATILNAHPGLRGILFDTPPAIANARQDRHINARELAGRIECTEGDFFDAVPGGADCYLLKYILHDWPDHDALRILQSVRRAATSTTRLLIVDAVVPPHKAATSAAMMDVNMMVIFGGLERTEEQFRRLLSQTGFTLQRVIPTECPLSILEALPT